MASGYLIAFGLIFTYIFIIFILRKTGFFDKWNMSLFGPILMIRTQKGKRLIEKISRLGSFWKWFANIGLAASYLSMFIMFSILILSAIGSTMKRVEPVPASDILVIPGVNKLIPLSFGLIALIIGIIVHEFSHGILALVGKLKVKSMGLLLLVIPIGAFVEPDAEELKNAPRLKRMRVYAAGPTMNIVVGLICALIFSWGLMGSLTPVEDGAMVFTISVGYPAEETGMEVGMLITNITVYHNVTRNDTMIDHDPMVNIENRTYNGSLMYDELGQDEISSKRISNDTYTWLVNLDDANFTISHFEVKDHDTFSGALAITAPEDKIDIGVHFKGNEMVFTNISLAHKYIYTEDEKDRGKGFLGVGAQDPKTFIEILHHPIGSADSAGEAALNLVTYSILLPMNPQVMPLHSPVTDMYEVTGFWSFLGDDAFWFLANTLYYIFWLNILIGTFNTLPSIPVDGGFIFKDTFSAVLDRMGRKVSEKKKERITQIVSISTALFVGFTILFIIFFPRFRLLFG